MKPLTQKQMLALVLKDLGEWLDSGHSDDSIVYAYNNGYKLHAANLWLGTGAASDEVLDQVKSLKISRVAEIREIKMICRNAYIYVCGECNHHGFYDEDMGESIQCQSCHKTAKRKLDV